MTTEQVKAKTKTVTRRLGWYFLMPGDELQAVEKAQGLRAGEKVKRLARLRVLSVRREHLDSITLADVAKEGFPDWTTQQFVDFFMVTHRVARDHWVTRIEFEYL